MGDKFFQSDEYRTFSWLLGLDRISKSSLSLYQWDIRVGVSCVVGVLVVDSFEFCSIYFIRHQT